MILYRRLLVIAAVLFLVSVACQAVTGIFDPSDAGQTVNTPAASATQAATPTALPSLPVEPGAASPDEPVFIYGEIPYTFPFFVNSLAEPFVMLEDQTGFIQRDRDFQFALAAQAIGPVEVEEDGTLNYSLALPAVPQGSSNDLDNDGEDEAGVQVFAVAYWSNTWGDPFLEERDGTGWSNAYASTITDPENEDEIIGGMLVVWAPDDRQSFPSGFGEDGLLFTGDEPVADLPAGYSIVDLNQEPFTIRKEATPRIILNEGEVAVNDFSSLSYSEAFEALFEKASREYPFSEEKEIDWQALHEEFAPRAAQASNEDSFYRVIRDFTYAIPDAHVGVSFNPNIFNEEAGGGFGLVLSELTDQRVIVTFIVPGSPADRAGIQLGAEILEWDNQPVLEAAQSRPVPYSGPFSTQHAQRVGQIAFLTRVPPGSRVDVTYQNPDQSPEEIVLQADMEYDSFFKALGLLDQDELALPVEGEVLDATGIGYIRIRSFSDDYNLMARLWERYLQGLLDNQIPALIIDLRANSGGSSGLAYDFAGYLFDEEFTLYRQYYYNENEQQFEEFNQPAEIEPGPFLYEGPIAVLVGPNCVSACEGFAYALQQDSRATIVGHYPTAGAFGEVGRGQYQLPGDLSVQFPTGRSVTLDGDLVIEGVGVVPDVVVPVTEESALGLEDAVLQAAVEVLTGAR